MVSSKRPRDYPETMVSAESGRLMRRGLKETTIIVSGRRFTYMQPGWWCDLKNPEDREGQLVDEDNVVAAMAERTASALAKGEEFTPVLIRAIRMTCGLTQAEAGRVFQTGEKSFEKYEAGEIRPSGPTKRLLRLAMERPDLFRKPSKGTIPVTAPADAALIRKTLKGAALDRIYAPLFKARTKQTA